MIKFKLSPHQATHTSFIYDHSVQQLLGAKQLEGLPIFISNFLMLLLCLKYSTHRVKLFIVAYLQTSLYRHGPNHSQASVLNVK